MAEDKLNQNSEQFNENISKASISAKGLVDSLADFGKGQIFQSLNSDIRQFSKLLDQSKDHVKDIKAGIIGGAEAQKKFTQFQKLNQQIQQKSQKLEANALKTMKGKSVEQRKNLTDQIKGLQDIGQKTTNTFKNANKFAQQGETRMVKFADSMSKAFSQKGMGNAAAASKGVATGMRKAALASKSTVKGFAKLVKLAPRLLSTVAKFAGIAAGPIGWIVTILLYVYDLFKLFLKVNSEVVMMSRELGISRDEARKLRNAFQAIAMQSNNWINQYHEIMLSHADFNAALKQSIGMFHGQAGILDGMATLRNRFNLTNEAATQFGLLAATTKQEIGDLVDGVGIGARHMNTMFGKTMNLKEVLTAAASVSGELRAIYAQYPEELGNAVQTSLALGKNIKDIFNATRGLLDFESSIGKEIEAELFLNRNINAERLRAARMTGDMVVLQKELVKQMGNYSDFQKMNVFEREALANFLGFEVDALEDMVMKSTLLSDINKETNREEYEKIKAYRMQMTLQEKFNKTIEKLKYIFIDIFDGIENWRVPRWLNWLMGNGWKKGPRLGDVGSLGVEDAGNFKSAEQWLAGSDFGEAVGMQTQIPQEMNDFVIRTHPMDTFVMAGGTKLGGNNQMDTDRIVDAINKNRVISYDGWGSGATSDHMQYDSGRWSSK